MTGPVDLSTTAGTCPIDRGVLAVTGPDAEDFLQGQLSQDIAGLAEGQSSWSLILQPQGRIDALVRVTRQGADRFILDTDGPLEQVITRLVGPVPTGGIDVIGPAPQVSADVPSVGPETLEAHRIRAGFPRMGVDIDDRTIPAEAEVVPFTVSFTKGCFTGQELVARMDSRGSTAPRYLRFLTLQGRANLGSGDQITNADGADVGAVTSAAWDAAADSTVALGYIKRAVEMPAEVNVAGGRARASAVPR